jgi:hypothetical protein
MYGIMKLQGGGPPGSGEAKHEKFKGSYKTGSRKGTAAGDKGDKKSQAKTARELDELIIGGDVTRGGKAFLSGKISAAERRQQLMDLANRARGKGIPFALNPEEFTGNLRGLSNAAKIGKLREGMSGADYHNYMRGLYDANPAAMETAFPWGSGKRLRGLANLAVPAPLKMLGRMTEQIRKDVGPGLQKLWGDIKAAPSGFARDAKALLTGKLSPTETANIGIAMEEQQDEQKNPLENLIQDDPTLEDTQDEILEDILGVDTSQNIAYDPRQDVPINAAMASTSPQGEGFNQGNKWAPWKMSESAHLLDPLTNPYLGLNADYETGAPNPLEDIFDPSQNVMPHVPISLQQKAKAVDEGYGWNDPDDQWVGEEEILDQFYNKMREAQEKGWEYRPFKGVVNKDSWRAPEWQHPGTDELVDQINWNTANRPLDWSGGETPELTDELIKENFVTDWGWNDGGYLKKYDDGGYANMSTFEKLKAINDSIAEG